MAHIEIYCTRSCPFCIMAKRLLNSKVVNYRSIYIEGRPDLREEMIARSGGHYTVPQIFVDGKHIGDCDQLYILDDSGKLDELLSDSNKPETL